MVGSGELNFKSLPEDGGYKIDSFITCDLVPGESYTVAFAECEK